MTVVTVTPNPALDLTWRAGRVVPGGSHRVPAAGVRAGGKGVNVARVLHAQGIDVRALTTAGGATGRIFADELAESGVPHRIVPVAVSTRRSAAIVDETLGDTSIFNERGENPTAAEWAELVAAADEELERASVLVVSGSLPPGAPEAIVEVLVSAAHGRGVPAIVDTSGSALLRAARVGADLLKPNREELAHATGLADPIAGAVALVELGAGGVLCSLGAEGMLLIAGPIADDGAPAVALRARLPEPLAGNPTGAGDAAVAGAASLLSADVPIRDVAERLLRRSTAWSAAAVLAPLAGEIDPAHAELAERLDLLPVPLSLPRTDRA
ncbi:ribokinase [Leucobacter sp. OLIS6]|uniref:1-phosphofructokinase family hexose kinase n=2 Tax=Leucobacter TaxID=55968 RepID=UPI000C1981F2|nr:MULTISPECIES: hexose kinase [unclassified Leucobacter]PII84150.1 ribokinase [Leucobacter sp. OLCALW19]PII92234.1 ribokinase [Leucobacter sp. OLAS13]PII95292.1 ribokinase [Leucobacter sp. OLTLW20]PII99784.1 ribokinase [Leucobacter sp. OLDS2]PIJ02741.1 ribokinase [Leucobacter sp. OLIS6]